MIVLPAIGKRCTGFVRRKRGPCLETRGPRRARTVREAAMSRRGSGMCRAPRRPFGAPIHGPLGWAQTSGMRPPAGRPRRNGQRVQCWVASSSGPPSAICAGSSLGCVSNSENTRSHAPENMVNGRYHSRIGMPPSPRAGPRMARFRTDSSPRTVIGRAAVTKSLHDHTTPVVAQLSQSSANSAQILGKMLLHRSQNWRRLR
jgi:hypothetical protein